MKSSLKNWFYDQLQNKVQSQIDQLVKDHPLLSRKDLTSTFSEQARHEGDRIVESLGDKISFSLSQNLHRKHNLLTED